MRQVKIPRSGECFTVGKIVCIGRNYREHIRELGNEVPDAPVLFMKPATSLIGAGEEIVIPAYARECHHEVELALLIGRRAKAIREEEALDCIAGYGVAIDLTLRDVQSELKKKGLPWEIAKAFDTACPLSDFVPAAEVVDPQALQISLSVNGSVRQDSNTALMMRPIPQLLREISEFFTLEPGDVVLTGTPEGVGPLVSGDRVRAEIAAVGTLEVRVA